MFDGYNKIFWGSLIMTFHINIGVIKILPSFVGLILISNGVGILYREAQNPKFDEAKKWVLVALVLSIVSEILRFMYSGSEGQGSLIFVIWTLVYLIIELLFIFKILEATIEELDVQGYSDLAVEFVGKQKIYTIFYIISSIFMIISMTYIINSLGVIAGLIAFGLRIYIIVLINRLKKLYKPVIEE